MNYKLNTNLFIIQTRLNFADSLPIGYYGMENCLFGGEGRG